MFNEGIGGVGGGNIPEKPLITPVEKPYESGDKPNPDPSETPPKPAEGDTVEVTSTEQPPSQPEVAPSIKPKEDTKETGSNIDIKI